MLVSTIMDKLERFYVLWRIKGFIEDPAPIPFNDRPSGEAVRKAIKKAYEQSHKKREGVSYSSANYVILERSAPDVQTCDLTDTPDGGDGLRDEFTRRGVRVWKEYAISSVLQNEYYGQNINEDIREWATNEVFVPTLDGEYEIRFRPLDGGITWVVHVEVEETSHEIAVVSRHENATLIHFNSDASRFIRQDILDYFSANPKLPAEEDRSINWPYVVGLIGK